MIKRVLHPLEGTDDSITDHQVQDKSADPSTKIDVRMLNHRDESNSVEIAMGQLHEDHDAEDVLTEKC
jgi:hypothetical protein